MKIPNDILEKISNTRREQVIIDGATETHLFSMQQVRHFLLISEVSYSYHLIRVGDRLVSSSSGIEFSIDISNGDRDIIAIVIVLKQHGKEFTSVMFMSDVHSMDDTEEDYSKKIQGRVGYSVSIALRRSLRGTPLEILDMPEFKHNSGISLKSKAKEKENVELVPSDEVAKTKKKEDIELDVSGSPLVIKDSNKNSSNMQVRTNLLGL